MKKCPYCGQEYPDDAVVCPVDEEPLEPATPAPKKVLNEAEPDNKPDVSEDYDSVGQFDPGEAGRILQRFEKEGIRFLIDHINRVAPRTQLLRKRSYIEIFVHRDDNGRAGAILFEDTKL